MKRKADDLSSRQALPKRNKPLDPSDKLVRLLRSNKITQVGSIMVELRHLGKRAIRPSVLQGLKALWASYPEQVIESMHKHLLRRNTEAICVLFMSIDQYSRVVTILRVLAQQAQTVFIFTPLTRLPMTRFCHFVVGLKAAFKNDFSVKKFVDQEFRNPRDDSLQAVMLNPRIAGKHSSWVGRIVLKLLYENTQCSEIQSLCKVVALSTLNLAVGFNDAVVCRSNDTKTQVFMDYAGKSLRQCTENKPQTLLSIVAQTCMAFYATHKYLKCVHLDAHQGNITLLPWLESMGTVLAYVIEPKNPGDCIPHHLVQVDTDAEFDTKEAQTVAALQIDNPTVRVRLVDWGMACPFEDVRLAQSLLRNNHNTDFVKAFAEWTQEHEMSQASGTLDWWAEAEFAGDFLLETLGVYNLELDAMSTYTRFDIRLIDYFALLTPLAAQWLALSRERQKVESMFLWLRAFIGRLAMSWLQTGIPVTETYVLGALKDMFDKRLLVQLFDNATTFWKRKFRYAPSINSRDKDTYTVVLQRETDELSDKIHDQFVSVRSVALYN